MGTIATLAAWVVILALLAAFLVGQTRKWLESLPDREMSYLDLVAGQYIPDLPLEEQEMREKAAAEAPPAPPTPLWPGKPSDYRLVVFRDESRRIIEERIFFEYVEDIGPAIARTRGSLRPGQLERAGRGSKKSQICVRW